MSERSRALFRRALAIGTSALLLAACGSSGTKRPAASSPSSTTTAGAPFVTRKTDPNLGAILADRKGMTLYTLTNNGQAVPCTGACVTAWPPLTLPAGTATPTGAPGVTGLATAAGPDGAQIVTFAGLPLYRFSRDTGPGDAKGEGIQSFGGIWHVAKVSGASPAAPAATTQPPASTSPTSPPATSGAGGY